MDKVIRRSDVLELGHAEKTILIEMLQEQILLLKEKIGKLEKKTKDLEAKSNKNSRNSHKPPSSDLKKPPKKTTSSKKKTGKRPGGQPGRKGITLKLVKNPDKTVRFEVNECEACGKSLKNKRPRIKKRQEFEIPKPKMFVTEYQTESKQCCCGTTTSSAFPSHITHAAQYGARAKSLMVYMNQHQFLPFDRASQFFETIYQHKISPATIVNSVHQMGNRLKVVENQIKAFLKKSKRVHCDETSMSIKGNKQWLHTVGNDQVTHYAFHEKRGKQATLDIGILPDFSGTMVHDHWKSYFHYHKSKHALCNAHHLRELRYIYENHGIKWADKMARLLLEIKNHKGKHLEKGKKSFSRYLLNQYHQRYDAIIVGARREQAIRGTIDSHNLMKRLKKYKSNVLLFMHDFDVPFTNNLSEQDLRMSKTKQKISGCFRHIKHGHTFCRIRSLLISAKKNKKNIFDMIQEAFRKIITLDMLLAT